MSNSLHRAVNFRQKPYFLNFGARIQKLGAIWAPAYIRRTVLWWALIRSVTTCDICCTQFQPPFYSSSINEMILASSHACTQLHATPTVIFLGIYPQSWDTDRDSIEFREFKFSTPEKNFWKINIPKLHRSATLVSSITKQDLSKMRDHYVHTLATQFQKRIS